MTGEEPGPWAHLREQEDTKDIGDGDRETVSQVVGLTESHNIQDSRRRAKG